MVPVRFDLWSSMGSSLALQMKMNKLGFSGSVVVILPPTVDGHKWMSFELIAILSQPRLVLVLGPRNYRRYLHHARIRFVHSQDHLIAHEEIRSTFAVQLRPTLEFSGFG